MSNRISGFVPNQPRRIALRETTFPCGAFWPANGRFEQHHGRRVGTFDWDRANLVWFGHLFPIAGSAEHPGDG